MIASPVGVSGFRFMSAAIAFAVASVLAGCESLVSAPVSPALRDDPTLPEPPTVEILPPESGREFDCASDSVDPGPTLSRRLTTTEYVNAVMLAVGADVSLEAGALLPEDQSADGFSNSAYALIVSADHVEAYAALARAALEKMDMSDFLDRHSGCRTLEPECVTEFLSLASGPVLRGPLSVGEIEAFESIFLAVQEENGTFEEAATYTVEAMLQSPRFIYRLETQLGEGASRTLDPFELASRLSFLLWASGPDQALWTAAMNGELQSAQDIEAQVDRMVSDPRAEAAAGTFFDDWLTLNRVPNIQRDSEHFPDWSGAIAQAMADETRAFVQSVVWDEGRPLTDLFNAQYTIASEELAAFYGLDSSSEQGGRYDLSGVPERGGILTQGSLLTIGGDEASMVARGLFVLDNFMCGSIDSPPDGIDITPPEQTPDATHRDIALTRVESSACGGCHAQIEPPAFGLERFDSTGRYLEQDGNGNALRSDGSLLFPGADEALPFETISEMMELIAANERTQECIVLKGTQYALGRTLTQDDACGLAEIRNTFLGSEQTYADLMRAIATSTTFRSVRVEQRVSQ
ncbi:MAG: DUF1592 domain-containing protein [Myxococcota bacterium]